jgi:hypothetical protein
LYEPAAIGTADVPKIIEVEVTKHAFVVRDADVMVDLDGAKRAIGTNGV